MTRWDCQSKRCDLLESYQNGWQAAYAKRNLEVIEAEADITSGCFLEDRMRSFEAEKKAVLLQSEEWQLDLAAKLKELDEQEKSKAFEAEADATYASHEADSEAGRCAIRLQTRLGSARAGGDSA
eukprot:152147-Rhodomonas_salina.6